MNQNEKEITSSVLKWFFSKQLAQVVLKYKVYDWIVHVCMNACMPGGVYIITQQML